MESASAGTLFIVATPIGNLDDISLRAIAVLRSVDAICAEDTRHSRALLVRHGIDRPLLALHEHNEAQATPRLLERLSAGQSLALISDAGTPLISDPGFRLVRAARAAGVPVRPLPGPCAAIAALSVAGLPSDRFCFEGFLPAKTGGREARLRDLRGETRTLIFYESAHRIGESLAALRDAFGAQRPALLAREMTKLYETVLDGTLGTLAARVEADPEQRKGEFVLIVQGAQPEPDAALAEGRRLYAALARHLPPAQAARLAAEISGAPRKALYEESKKPGPRDRGPV